MNSTFRKQCLQNNTKQINLHNLTGRKAWSNRKMFIISPRNLMLARLKITALDGVRSKILTWLGGQNGDRLRYTCNAF